MSNESQAIEVEVVEIDGTPTPAKTANREDAPTGQSWQNWQGRVLKLDSRWWPLWVLLGIVAVALLLTFGVIIGIIVLIFKILRGLIHAVVR